MQADSFDSLDDSDICATTAQFHTFSLRIDNKVVARCGWGASDLRKRHIEIFPTPKRTGPREEEGESGLIHKMRWRVELRKPWLHEKNLGKLYRLLEIPVECQLWNLGGRFQQEPIDLHQNPLALSHQRDLFSRKEDLFLMENTRDHIHERVVTRPLVEIRTDPTTIARREASAVVKEDDDDLPHKGGGESREEDELTKKKKKHALFEWIFQFTDALQWLPIEDLIMAERVCRFVNDLVHAHKVWKVALDSNRKVQGLPALRESEIISSEPNHDNEGSSSLPSVRMNREWKKRCIQHNLEVPGGMQNGGLIRTWYSRQDHPVGNRTPQAVSTIVRVPRKAIKDHPRGIFQSDPLLDRRLGLFMHFEANDRIAILLYCFPLRHMRDGAAESQPDELPTRVTFQIAPLTSQLSDIGSAPSIYRSTTRDFSQNRSTFGWSFALDSFGPTGEEDIRVLVQAYIHPPYTVIPDALEPNGFELITEGCLPMWNFASSKLKEVLDDRRFTTTFKLMILQHVGEVVRGANQSDRKITQNYILPSIAKFMERELQGKCTGDQLAAACSVVWNVFDTQEFSLPEEAMSDLANSILQCAKKLSPEEGGFGAIFGSLWNIPIKPRYRELLASHQDLLIKCVKPQVNIRFGPMWVSHFVSGLHLLATLRHYDLLTEGNQTEVDELLHKGLDFCDHPAIVDSGNTGVSLSSRDFADFFLPLLMGKCLSSIRFAAFFVDVTYFRFAEETQIADGDGETGEIQAPQGEEEGPQEEE